MAITGTTGTAASALPAAGGTSTAGLSDWAAPYITDYLSKAQALSNTPYQTYQGPLTAGPSDLQNKVFQGIGNLAFPSNLGQSFSSPMGNVSNSGGMPYPANPNDPAVSSLSSTPFMDGPEYSVLPQQSTPLGGIAGPQPLQPSQQPSNIAQSYMNPYLQSVLDPQLAELRRQNDITNMMGNSKLTQAGAYGGGRQAIMNAENNRNLMQEMNKTVGQGYATAYDKAMGQFNTEQGQGRDLAKMMSDIGGIQRNITTEGLTADLNEFNTQRDFPYKQLQFQRDMISGLPSGSVTNTPGQLSGIAQLISSAGGIDQLRKQTGQKDLGSLLKGFGLNFGGTEETV